jgi:DNA-binding MarR family transcriptional regulator
MARAMPTTRLREYRNSKLYRPLSRTLRVYHGRLIAGLHARGFTDFSAAFPALLSNLDVEGTRVGVLAARAGVTRQAAGQLIREIERCGYVARHGHAADARATIVRFTPRGRALLDSIFALVEETEAQFATVIGRIEFERVKRALVRLANHLDPGGVLGEGDEPPRSTRAAPQRAKTRRPAKKAS